jgi:hypothetical protein
MKAFQLALAIFLTCILIFVPNDREEIEAQEDLYCKMVQLSIDTQGDLGWPDYENKFKRVCAA